MATLVLVVGCGSDAPRFVDAGPPDVVDATPPIDAGADVDAAPATGRTGTATVSGAVRASSASYRLYGTLRSGDGASASASYRRRGGVVGATQ